MASSSQTLKALRPVCSLPRASGSSYFSRAFSSGTLSVQAKTQGQNYGATKTSRGFKAKKDGRKFGRSGGDLSLIRLDEKAPEFRPTRVVPNIPELHEVEVTPLLRHSPIAFGSGKGSLASVFGVPKSVAKENIHLSRPFSIVRQVTLDSYKRMDSARETPSQDNRIVLTGPTGNGKSIALMQIAEYCAAQNWIVLYVPRAIDWVNSSSPYQYDARTRTFTQPMIANSVLKQLIAFNGAIFETMLLRSDVVLERGSIPAGTSYLDLASQGAQDPTLSTVILSALLQELEKETETPVLLAIDDFQALYNVSAYRDPLYRLIQAYHLSMPRIVLEYASGMKSFARGAIVGAISTTDTSYPVPIDLSDALLQTRERRWTNANVWMKRNLELRAYTSGLTALPVPDRFTVHEAAALIEMWEQSDALHTKFNESAFMSKLAESSGNPREFLHKGYLSTLVTW